MGTMLPLMKHFNLEASWNEIFSGLVNFKMEQSPSSIRLNAHTFCLSNTGKHFETGIQTNCS
jgi:hypothetical protein